MSIIKDVAEALGELTELIENTRSIIKAINDGREYLARQYPDASGDFSELLRQMQVTVEGLAEVTGVVQSFRFTIGSRTAAERSLERFNKHLIKHNAKVTTLRGKSRKLKTDCNKIRVLRDKLNERSSGQSWSRMFSLLGLKAGQRRDKLASTIGNFYADDLRMIDVIEDTLRLAKRALADVDRSLGKPGEANPCNVPRAAGMLAIYSDMFSEPHQKLQDLANKLGDAANSLQRD